jgi:putative ABC transport system permease protein
MSDLAQALRLFRKTPGFTAVVLLTLALGIGGSTTIFSIVNGVLLRPLPYSEPDRIVSVQSSRPGAEDPAHAPADFLDLQREQQSFSAVAGHRGDVIDITSDAAEPVRLDGALVTHSFFDVFGVPAARGRTFTAADPIGGDRLLVISDGVWRQQFGASPDAIGRPVRVNGIPHVLVGVMPYGFEWPAGAEAWAMSPLPVPPGMVEVEGNLLEQREVRYFQAVARLRPGVSEEQASRDVAAIGQRLGERHARSAGRVYSVVPIREELVGDVRQGLFLLLGAVGCVLLIACANVAGLLVARGVGRQREVGIRTALGAPRGRIVRQLLVESLLLSLAGGGLGLLLASWGTDAIVAIIPDSIPRLGEVRIDGRVSLFAVSVSVATGILFGLAPALQTANVNVVELLRDGGRTAGSHSTRRMRAALVAAEVALALVLLVTAGLMINSFVRLRAVDPGYSLEQVVTADVALPGSTYGTKARQAGFYRQLLDRLQTSAVTSTSAVTFPRPFSESGGQAGFEVEHAPPLPDRERPRAQLSIASPQTFRALGIPLMAGRPFTEADVEDAPNVVIVNESFAKKYWPGENALGKRITFDQRTETTTPAWSTVVAVVGDTRIKSLDLAPQPTVYFSYHQFSLPFMTVVVRGTSDTAAVARELRAHLRALDPNLPVGEVGTLGTAASQSAAQPRFRTYVLASFASISLLLAAVGLYGLMSYSVTQRVREIGVRMALGARPRDVLRLVITEGMTLVALGAAAGVGVAVAAGRLIGALLFGVSPTDPVTYGAVLGVLAIVASAACTLPALRAARVNPMSALRSE